MPVTFNLFNLDHPSTMPKTAHHRDRATRFALTCLAAAALTACASVKTTTETNYIAHATTEWPLLTAQRAATRQAARLSGWAQEAERRHVWEDGQMLPIAPVPTFGFKENDQPALFTAGNRIPPPPVTTNDKLAASGVRQARLESLHDCALTYGVRQGMREQMARIQHVLGREDVAKMMDDAFDFAPVMLTRYLVPPSVTESRDEYEQQNAGTLRLREARYHVVTQARFTSVRPNWRGFMHQIFVSDDERSPCSAQAFGLSGEEHAWWQKAEALSRIQGIEAANLVFSNSLERLASTHTGMLKYHEWSWRGLIDIPQIAQSKHILTLDPKSQDARLHERLLRVTHLPRFDERRSTWEAAAPHMEESKAAAIDLALPVCSGKGCSNDRFAFGGLRHAASEEYFIHPTLILRGAGGYELRSEEPPATVHPVVMPQRVTKVNAPAVAEQVQQRRPATVRRTYSHTPPAVTAMAPVQVKAQPTQPATYSAPKQQAETTPAPVTVAPTPVTQPQPSTTTTITATAKTLPASAPAVPPVVKEQAASEATKAHTKVQPASTPALPPAPKAQTASAASTGVRIKERPTLVPAYMAASKAQSASSPEDAPVAAQGKKTRPVKAYKRYRASAPMAAASQKPAINEQALAAARARVKEMDERYKQRAKQLQAADAYSPVTGTKAHAAVKKSTPAKTEPSKE